MKLVLQGKNIEITEAIREYVERKIEKATLHFQQFVTKVEVNLSVVKNARSDDRQIAEVTLHANGTIVRAQESSERLYASIDLVTDKVIRKLRKYKERLASKKERFSAKEFFPLVANEIDLPLVEAKLTNGLVPQLPAEVVRNKYFSMPPMTMAQALEHLQLVDHDFYMFLNVDTGQINVVYERNHGGYGVLQPMIPQTNGNGDPSTNGNGHTALPINTEPPVLHARPQLELVR
jgi:putative sigma-54 modulation protein